MEKIIPHLVEKPWAGDFLSKHYRAGSKAIGEAWLLSCLPEGESRVGDKTLSAFLGGSLPFVVKVIDAKEPLSIQVHPNDEWAAKLENSKGKTECWLILNSSAGAGVYLGLREGVSETEFSRALSENRAVDKLMKFYPVDRGDFITVPAGTIHAIGGGVTLLEVQQASGITYRLWDWGREGRELHIEKGMKVSEFAPKFTFRKNVIGGGASVLMKHVDFACYFNESHGSGWFIDLDSLEVSRADRTDSANYVFVC